MYICVCIYIYMSLSLSIYIYIYVHYIYIYTYLCVYIYIYTYRCTHVQSTIHISYITNTYALRSRPKGRVSWDFLGTPIGDPLVTSMCCHSLSSCLVIVCLVTSLSSMCCHSLSSMCCQSCLVTSLHSLSSMCCHSLSGYKQCCLVIVFMICCREGPR